MRATLLIRPLCRRAPFLAACLWAFLALGADPAVVPAHGGYPLSLGTASGGRAEAAARLVSAYLREGQGMTVELRVLGSAEDLAKAYGDGRIDLLVHLPDRSWRRSACGGGQPGEEKRAGYFRDLFGGAWSAPFKAGSSVETCGLSLAAHPRVVGDVRFSLLEKTLGRLLAAVDGDEIAVLHRDAGGEPRSRRAAARELLRGKGLL